MTFLDMVRALGALSLDKCDPECSPKQHRRESAEFLGILIAHPELAAEIADAAKRAGKEIG